MAQKELSTKLDHLEEACKQMAGNEYFAIVNKKIK